MDDEKQKQKREIGTETINLNKLFCRLYLIDIHVHSSAAREQL